MAGSTLIQIRNERLEKVAKLRAMGIDPYPAKSYKNIDNQELHEKYSELENKEFVVAGRLMSWRTHGQIIFADIYDQSGKLQLYIKLNQLQPTSKQEQSIGEQDLNLLDLGDFVEAYGTLTKTKSGEVSILVTKLRILSKALRPLPDSWAGLKNKEERYRRRYLDLAINPEVREIFVRKSKFWRKAREFMIDRGFIEVETPILEFVPGGADARPFITHHNALNQNFYLRISSELYQKRLIGGGFDKIFVLGPNFRNEGIDDEHLQEYYQLEYYWAYTDINDTIKLTKDLYKYLAEEVWGKTAFERNGMKFDLASEWEMIDYVEVIRKHFNVNVFNTPLKEIHQLIKDHGIDIEFDNNRNRLVDNLWKIIRKQIAGPAALVNAPKFISPLAKSYFGNEQITQRFQPIIAGSEVGNAYSELNDPVDQLNRFIEQQELRNAGDDEAQMLDIDFVEMLEYGMPPTSCIGFSERLFWFLEGVTAREGTFFPQMKFELDETTKNIYKGIEKYIDPNIEEKPKHKIVIKSLDNPEKITIDEDVKSRWDSITIGYAEIEGVNIQDSNPQLEKLKKEVIESLKGIDNEEISAYPEIQSYRRLYKETGIDWHSRRPSPEALLRRIAQGKGLYKVNTCVDAYNLVVIKNRVSVGAFDRDKIRFPIRLRLANGGENITLLGDEQPTVLKTGEISYFDGIGPYNLDFNYRDADRTKVTIATKNLMINVEGIYDISSQQVENALKETIESILNFCGGKLVVAGIIRK